MKLADILVKLKRMDEAFSTYEEVAEEYTSDKFLIQAVSVYKIIQQLDPKRSGVAEKLEELNQMRGIPSVPPKPAAAPPDAEPGLTIPGAAPAEEAQKNLATAIKEAREKMDAVDQEMARVRDEILTAGKMEGKRIIEEATERSQRLLDDTRALVGHEAHRIADAIKEETAVAIVEAAEKIIREKIAPDDHERLTSEYIKQIIEESAASSSPGK